MNVQRTLLSLAIVSGLAAAAPTDAVGNAKAVAAGRADVMIATSAAQAVHRASADTFVASDVTGDARGNQHVRYQRSYRGLPVIGGDFVVHLRNGAYRSVSQTLRTAARPSLVPHVGSDQALVEAGARFGRGFTGTPTSRMVVYARGASPVLAYEVVFNGTRADQTPTEMHYFVDARSGKVLDQWDGIETVRRRPGPNGGGGNCSSGAPATGTGHSLTEGDVAVNTTNCGSSYQMTDLTRGNGSTHNMAMRTSGMGTVYTDADNTWGNGQLNDAQTVGVDAHYGVALTWDYYKNLHGRNGIADDGRGAISRVHYGRNYQNAFWSDACFCMTFGDGDNGASILPFVALDVAGHEMSHGVTSHTAGLVYSGESGGLNEANSDINGTQVEFYANNPNDPGDYVIGEELFPDNADLSKAIRWMFKPSLDGSSPDCYQSGIGGLNVHYSSGVANHFFYLLSEGAVVPAGFGAETWANLTSADLVCDGNTALAGIGQAKAGQIWYHALVDYMTSNTDYAGARAATISASTDLYGATSPETNAVKAAWAAVSVN